MGTQSEKFLTCSTDEYWAMFFWPLIYLVENTDLGQPEA